MATRAWYRYYSTPGGELAPINYLYVSALPPTCEISNLNICAVLGVYLEGASYPGSFSARINSYISEALSHAAARPTTGKIFVYVKA